MATVALTTTPATLDAGGSDFVTVTNTGAVDVTVSRGSQSFTLRPTQARQVYPEGVPVTASVASGAGQVTTTAQAARQSQVQQFAADPAFTGTYAREGAGFWVPTSWGTKWRAKLATAASTPARVKLAGDSVGRGMYTSDPDSKAWFSLLRTELQSLYGDGGSGFKSAGDSSLVTAADAGAPFLLSIAGSWADGVFSEGPSRCAIKSTLSGDTVTVTVRGTTAKIFWVRGTGAAWQYTVDGGSVVTPTVTGGNTIAVTTITGLSAGSHTIVITALAANFYFCGAAGENATGVIADNHSVNGRQGANLNATTATYGLPSAWMGGASYPCDLLFYAFGLNDDATGNIAGDVFSANARKFLDGVMDNPTTQGATDLVFLLNHRSKNWTTNYNYQEYANRLRGLAENYGAAYINLGPTWRNSWDYAAASNFWGTGTGWTGVAGTDNAHPSDTGHALMYAQIKAALPRLTSLTA